MAKAETLIDFDKARKLLRKRSKVVSLRLNPDLVKLLDTEAANQKFENRNELIEELLIKYFLQQGKI